MRTVFHLRRVQQWSACACVHDCRIHNEGTKTIKVVCGSVFPVLEFVVSAWESRSHQSWHNVCCVFMCSRELSVQILKFFVLTEAVYCLRS